jgi:hypothetical protein
MKLKSFGCSFIFGSELSDDGRGTLYATPSQLTWPAHLASHLNYNYECYARPGSGNLQILEQILTQSANKTQDLFAVGWTWIDRFDYYPVNPTSISRSPWRTIMPVDTDDLAKVYYRDMHSEYRDKFTCLSYIKLAIDTLNQKGIPFIMTYMDNLLFDQRWHTTPAVLDLQEYIKPYMTQFEGKSFLEWSRNQGHPETTAWHPLEEAHAAAGEYMIKVFDKQKTNDPAH